MRERPIWVWLICLYIAFSAASAVAGLASAFLFDNPETQWARDYYSSLSGPQMAIQILSPALALSAAAALFFMRRIAAPLFTAVLIVGIGNSVWQASAGWIARQGVEAIGWVGVLVSLAVGAALMGVIVAYVWWLRAKGRLA